MGERYTRYLYELAGTLGCGLRLEPDLAGMMYVEFGYVEGPHPETSVHNTPQVCFAVGLHELGHVAYGDTQGRPPMGHLRNYFNGVLRAEAVAWEFALVHFDIFGEEPFPATRRYMWERCLNSYLTGAKNAGGTPSRLLNGNRHHVEFIYDEPDDYFWSVQQRIMQGATETFDPLAA